jgi:membrane fusion protein, heavy metal efflux system
VPVVAPATAIQKVEGRPVVFVRTGEGFEKRDVVLGQKEDQGLEIIPGLMPGETIAATNTFSLKAELSKPKDED